MSARTFLILLLSITIARLALVWLFPQDLFGDEAQYWFWSQDLAFGYFSKPPFLAWGLAAVQEVCGSSEACLRTPAALIHGAIALLLAASGKYLLGNTEQARNMGRWAGVIYLFTPGAVFSSVIVNTDLFLLLFWMLALFALLRLLDREDWTSALLLGVAIGCGLLSKYAMLFFLIGLVVAIIALPRARLLLRLPQFYAALVIAGVIFNPNVFWNISQGWITVEHTSGSAGWSWRDPLAGTDWRDPAEFFAGQLLVFGPLAWLLLFWFWRQRDGKGSGSDGFIPLLLLISLPILLIYGFQAFLARAFLNWAAAAYLGLSLVAAYAIIRSPNAQRFAWAHIALGVLFQALISIVLILHSLASPLVDTRLLQRVKNWDATMQAFAPTIVESGQMLLLHDDRLTFGEAAYYLRDLPVALDQRMLKPGSHTDNHYALVAPFDPESAPDQILWLTPGSAEISPIDGFAIAERLQTVERGVLKQRRNSFKLLLLERRP